MSYYQTNKQRLQDIFNEVYTQYLKGTVKEKLKGYRLKPENLRS